MTHYATDTDLLHWEPDLFQHTSLVSQTLLSGTADLSGTTLVLSNGSLITAGVKPGHVVTLAGSIAGSFPVIAVNTATVATISAMYERLKPDDDDTPPRPIGTATGAAFTIKTFLPQIGLISEQLRLLLGVDDPRQVLSPQSLRQPAATGTLFMIFSTLAAATDDAVEARKRAVRYERIYHRQLRAITVRLDLNNDGITDTLRCPGVIQLRRAA